MLFPNQNYLAAVHHFFEIAGCQGRANRSMDKRGCNDQHTGNVICLPKNVVCLRMKMDAGNACLFVYISKHNTICISS